MAHRTCEARVWAYGIDRPCGQQVGLRVWYDESGELHQACRAHVAERVHRYPEADPPEPKWLPSDVEYVTGVDWSPDPIDEYKAYTDAGYSEAELRASWGDR